MREGEDKRRHRGETSAGGAPGLPRVVEAGGAPGLPRVVDAVGCIVDDAIAVEGGKD